MDEKTEPPSGCDPERGNSCNCLKNCCYYNNSPNSLQTLADIMLASLKPALRSFVDKETTLTTPLNRLIFTCSEAVLAEVEKRERGSHER